ncbi:MAG: voltage-gated potassium channel [Mycobacterium sp.]|jgi:hypothetical protein|nr:voltage-gated potassium channel [Mycobacterium sp.]
MPSLTGRLRDAYDLTFITPSRAGPSRTQQCGQAAVTATLASWIVQRVAEEDTAKQAATAAQIDALRIDLEHQVETLRTEIQRLADAVTERQKREAI